MHADDVPFDAQVDVLRHQDHLAPRLALGQRQCDREDAVVGLVARQTSRQLCRAGLGLEEQSPGLARAGAGQWHARFDLVAGHAVEQFVEAAADLPRVTRHLGVADLGRVEFLEHDHRNEQVVLVELEQCGRVMHQHVGVEHKELGRHAVVLQWGLLEGGEHGIQVQLIAHFQEFVA